MEKVRLDLFKLHDESDVGIGRIKAELNPQLRVLLKGLVEDIQEEGMLKLKYIAKIVGLPYNEFWRCLNEKLIPLEIIHKLLQLWSKVTSMQMGEKKNEIQDQVEWLTYGAGNTYKHVKAIKFITEDLAKITGAIVADGHIRTKQYESKFKKKIKRYIIILQDGFLDSVKAFCEWFMNTFEIILTPKYFSEQHYWYVRTNNKIVVRYLVNILDIPPNKKCETVKVPEIVKLSPNYSRAFATGVFMFDGGIDHRTGYFDLTTKSIELVNGIAQILEKFKLPADYVKDEIDPISHVCKLRVRKREKLRKFLNMFLEPNTTKWEQLNAHINGIGNFDNLSNIIEKLNTIYPPVRDGITFDKVITTIDKLKLVKASDLTEKLDRKKTVIYEYLKRLENWNVLKSSRVGLYKVWSINPNLK